jgi:Flp pilus assembly protein TadB
VSAVAGALLLAAAVACLVPGRPRLLVGAAAPQDAHGPRSVLSPATWAALGAGAAVLVLAPGPIGLVAAVAAAVVVRRKVATAETRADRRRRLLVQGELPHVVDLLASLLVAGAAPEEALARVRGVVHPVMGQRLAPWVDRLRLGADPVEVWGELASDPLLGRLGVSLRRATTSGAPVADALARLGTDLRAVARTESLERVRQVEVRATAPLAVCLLPAFVLLGVVPLVAGTVGRLGLS